MLNLINDVSNKIDLTLQRLIVLSKIWSNFTRLLLRKEGVINTEDHFTFVFALSIIDRIFASKNIETSNINCNVSSYAPNMRVSNFHTKKKQDYLLTQTDEHFTVNFGMKKF